MPIDIRAYGMDRGGLQIEFETWPSTQASWVRVQDFQAKKAQNARLARSTSNWRT